MDPEQQARLLEGGFVAIGLIVVGLVWLCIYKKTGTSNQRWDETKEGLFLESNGTTVVWRRGDREPTITKAPGARGDVVIGRTLGSTLVRVRLVNGLQTMDGEFDWAPRRRRGRSPIR